MGKFGHWSKLEYVVWKCGQCKAGFLNRDSLDYESEEYRKLVDGESSPEHFYKIHDKEQADKLQILGTAILRGKVIADVGCGAGSFLDLVKGYAKTTIAIEPNRSFQQETKSKGHHAYSYCKDALNDWEGKVDLAISFAVIEHLDNPLAFLKEIKQLLKPNGTLLLSTPNYNDWLIDFLPNDYPRCVYRIVHKWYFCSDAIKKIANLAEFREINVQFVQRFDLSNALHWARDCCPTGLGKTPTFHDLNVMYKSLLETKGQSDFIYAWFQT